MRLIRLLSYLCIYLHGWERRESKLKNNNNQRKCKHSKWLAYHTYRFGLALRGERILMHSNRIVHVISHTCTTNVFRCTTLIIDCMATTCAMLWCDCRGECEKRNCIDLDGIGIKFRYTKAKKRTRNKNEINK